MLTLFYDGACPLCAREIAALKGHDVNNVISFVDINDQAQLSKYPHISYSDAQAVLHAIDAQGNILLGLDANVAAWNCVGKMAWLNVLRAPVIKVIADFFYRMFAKHRTKISGLISSKHCQQSCRRGDES